MFALWLLSRASEGAEAALHGLWAALGQGAQGMLGMRGCDCSGSHLGISANDNWGLEVSHEGSSRFEKTDTPTALSVVGGGLGDGFMAFNCPPPPAL